MPITYTIDEATHIVLEVWNGPISARDLGEHWRSCLADPVFVACGKSLVDVRESQIRFSGPELSRLVSSIVVPMLGSRKWVTALVVGSAAQFGTARQYGVFSESFGTDSVFSDYEAAWAWVTSQ